MRTPNRQILLLGVVALLVPSIGDAQETRTFDPTFQRTPLRVTSESASGVKVLSSGKVLIYTIQWLYLMSGANGQRIGALVRMDPNTGAIDPTWHPDPTLTASGFLLELPKRRMVRSIIPLRSSAIWDTRISTATSP